MHKLKHFLQLVTFGGYYFTKDLILKYYIRNICLDNLMIEPFNGCKRVRVLRISINKVKVLFGRMRITMNI